MAVGAPGLEPSPAFVIHDFSHARIAAAAAAEAGRRVLLITPPDSAIALGLYWLNALAAELRRDLPAADFLAVLDCGDRQALAHEALRAGVEAVCFTGPPDQAAGLAEVARALGRPFFAGRPAALDLGAVPPKRRIDAAKAWIRNPPLQAGVE